MDLKFIRSFIVLSFVVSVFAVFAAAQAKRNSRQPAAPQRTATPEPTPARVKKNERPVNGSINSTAATKLETADPYYRYEFTQPDFLISKIVLEHDDSGSGMISFRRNSYDEDLTEPIRLSESTIAKLKAAFDALNFVDATEDYQFERDFSNMGNIAITLRKGGRQRTAKYNWTSNKEAKFLMDEYRRASNQFVWMFDFNLARENQPLETPKLVDSLDSLLKRNEIADPHQLLPFLQTVSNDERVPLIGRNHAGKLVKQIEKQKPSN